MDEVCGTLEKGKFADVISLKGNPLDDIWAISRVNFIMKGGERLDHVSWF
jgi:imidazolonepropionase-like amidohydrolase